MLAVKIAIATTLGSLVSTSLGVVLMNRADGLSGPPDWEASRA